MNVIILTEGPFPFGMAATNRMISYSRGLTELSCKVFVLCIKPSEPVNGPVRNEQAIGNYLGIDFNYVTGNTQRKKYLVFRCIDSLKGIIMSIRVMKKMHYDIGVNVVFVGLTNYFYTFFIYLFCRFQKIKIIQERSEFPFIGVHDLRQKLNLFIYLHVLCKLFDGLFVITNALKEYFKRYIRKNAKLMILPMLVEPDRFIVKDKIIKPDSEYIAYCGILSGEKDGVLILINAFREIAKKYLSLKLYLIGDTKDPDFHKIEEQIKKYDLVDRVVFTGRVERDQLPAHLNNAKILALARPASKQAEGGFPTKLGEYLATGKPVIVTTVGEIPQYLKDGENAFLVKPDDYIAFAEKLDFVLSNPELANRVGANGRKLVYHEFNYKVQSQKLLDFISSL